MVAGGIIRIESISSASRSRIISAGRIGRSVEIIVDAASTRAPDHDQAKAELKCCSGAWPLA